MFRKNVIFMIFILLTVFFQSCDDDEKKCPDGYVYKDGECVIDENDIDNDISIPDTDTETDLDTEDNELTDTDEISDDDTEPYTGSCHPVYSDEKLTINVAHKTLSVTSIKVESDETIPLNGEIWLQNKATASSFKLSSVSEITSETFRIPAGMYRIIYKDNIENFVLNLDEEIDLSSDTAVDIKIPLFRFSGSVTKNGSPFPSDVTNAQIKISKDSCVKTISKDSFADFTLILPKGTFSVEFNGNLSSSQPEFYGSLGTIEIGSETPSGINITTKTMTGTFNNAVSGVAVNTGYVMLSSGTVNAQILNLSSSSNYNTEIITNESPIYYLLYSNISANPGELLTSFQTLTYWNTADAVQPSYIPAEMIPVNLNSVTLNGGELPDFTCLSSDCTRGTISIKSKSNDSFILADLGKTGAFTPKTAFVSRVNPITWDPGINDGAGGFNAKTPSSFAIFFDGFLFDSDLTTTAPTSKFTSQLTGYTESVTKNENNEITEWLTAFPLTTADIQTFTVSGNMTASFEPSDDDLIYASQIIVSGSSKTYRSQTVVGKVLKNGSYSITLPAKGYNSATENPLFDVFYSGKSFLNTPDNFKKTVITSISPTAPALDSKNISIKGKDMTLEVKINGKSLKTFIEESDYIEKVSVIIYDEDHTSSYELPVNFNGSEPTFDMGGLTSWQVHLKFVTTNSANSLIVPIQTVTNTSLPVSKNIYITKFFFNTTIDGNIMSDQPESRGSFLFRNKILENSEDPSSTSYFITESLTEISSSGATYTPVLSISDSEYKDIRPRLTLGEGFPSKHEIITDCIYVGK